MIARTGLALAALVLGLATALALATVGCGPRGGGEPVDTTAVADTAGLGGMRVLERTRGAPGDSVEGHAIYRVEWPDSTLLPPGPGPLADSVRHAIAYALAEGQLDGFGRPVAPDVVAARFLAGHAEFRREFPQGPGEWQIERRITIETLPFGLTTLKIEDTRYEGGAHGNSNVFYESRDPATGRRLALKDLATGADMDSLVRIGERAFMETKGLASTADLKEQGWFWDEGRFSLSPNFGVTREGLLFHWNAYDINAYAAGPTTIVLPWSEVHPLLRRDGPLGGLQEASVVGTSPNPGH
jgi:hypothetical protein